MRRLRAPYLVLSLILVGSAAAQEAEIPAGPPPRSVRIPNALMDQHVEEPIRRATSAFDVYQVLVDWVLRVYPPDGEASQAARRFRAAVLQARGRVAARGGAGVTVEMPMSIDEFLRLLRREAPGLQGRELAKSLQGNDKARLFTAALLPFLHLRGITFRLRPLFERSFVLHTAAITWLRGSYGDIQVHHPPNQRALFQFLTYPMAEKGPTKVQFQAVSELQDWVQGELLPTWDVALELATQSLAALRPDFRQSLDLGLFLTGPKPFPREDLEPRDRVVDRSDIEAMVAWMHAVRSSLRSLLLYHLDDYPDASNALNRELVEGFFAEKVPFGSAPRKGFPSQQRYAVLRRFSRLYTLRDARFGPQVLADLRACREHADRAMRGYLAADPGERDDRMVNLRALKGFEREYLTKLAPQLGALLAGPATLTDFVGGAQVDIDLPGLLARPPADLKAFFPTRFVEDPEVREFQFHSGKVKMANYQYGNPRSWDQAPWRRLFPNLIGPMTADADWDGPLRAYRDVSRTYLGGWLGPALMLFVN